MTTKLVEAPTESTELNLVALTPADMVPAQHALIDWCGKKIQALKDEADELDLHQKLAIENGWKTSVVTANLNRTARRITYYEKMRAALDAGYLLVPNMPVDVMAIRVKGDRPAQRSTQARWSAENTPQQLLPSGEGRYVDDKVFTNEMVTKRAAANGQGEITERTYWPTEYDEADFPIAMTKPVVLDAVGRGMALKIFDRIGRVRNDRSPRRDPIYVGQIIRDSQTMATFFLAWWVDTRTL